MSRPFGFKHTEISKQKMSLAQKGKRFTEEHKRKIGITKIGNKNCLGRKQTEETKKKISIANKGNKS